MTACPSRRWGAALALVALCAVAPAAPARAQTPAAAPAAALDVDAQLHFLQTATVVSSKLIGKGITGAKRVTLTDGTRTHDAAFQAVANESVGNDVPRNLRRSGELRFVDHYRYNIAAWRLAQMLGLAEMMPPTVERTIGSPGALSWWVDDVLMDEEERQRSQAVAPNGSLDLARQFGRMSVFAELVRDTDRNKGNVVFTKSWRLIMLDFTRAFRLTRQLQAAEALNSCDRALLGKLRTLTAPGLSAAVRPHLKEAEIAAVLARRDLLVSHFDKLIAARGEAIVLY